MRTAFILGVVCVLVATACAQEWEGQYNDPRYGGIWYICEGAADSLHGAYSQIGITQLIRDEDNPNIATGDWYEGGAGTRSCSSGDLELELLANNDISVTYFCEDDDETTATVTASYISDEQPTFQECARLNGDGDARGYWVENGEEGRFELDICFGDDDDDYVASYSYPKDGDNENERIPGYETGKKYKDYIISGYYNEINERGNSLYFVLFDGTLGNFFYAALPGEIPDTTDDDDDDDSANYANGYGIFEFESDASDDECTRNEDIVGNYVYDDDDEAGFSGASSLVLPLVAIVSLAALCLF